MVISKVSRTPEDIAPIPYQKMIISRGGDEMEKVVIAGAARTPMGGFQGAFADLTAVDILERGGNAMDAAIAGAVLLGICEPQMTGIGGDCFVLYSPAGSEEVHALNGSGRAPAALDAAHLRDAGEKTVPLRSAHAVTIPGAISAWCLLHGDHGTMPLDRLFARAIGYAENGYAVTPRVAQDWAEEAALIGGDMHTTRPKPPLTMCGRQALAMRNDPRTLMLWIRS